MSESGPEAAKIDDEAAGPAENGQEREATGFGGGKRERRSETRHAVNLQAVAVRAEDRLPPSAPAHVAVTVVDISRSAVRWLSKDIFYRRELVGLRLDMAETGRALSCVVEVHRTRRLRGIYEVVGAFVRVRHADESSAQGAGRAAAPSRPPRAKPAEPAPAAVQPPAASPQVE